MKLVVATCQFPVSADTRKNTRHVLAQMHAAKERGAHVAHFCECALSGYAGSDFASYEGFDWARLETSTREVLALARDLRLWVVLGSTHPLTGRRKPHNSVYVINDRGRIIDRYDKLFCAGDRLGKESDLAHYTPGEHFCVFTLRGVRCGVLICHDYRYPELYREYKRRGVQLIFHSYHAGNVGAGRLALMRAQVGEENLKLNPAGTLPGITMPATMVASAASSHVWISCPNTSARQSCWPSFFVRPDGVVTGRMRPHSAGMLISTVDPRAPLYDSTMAWRKRAMSGRFHSGTTASGDPRSRKRTEL